MISYLGVITNHKIRLEHLCAYMQPSPLPISGVGMIERTLNWSPVPGSDQARRADHDHQRGRDICLGRTGPACLSGG